MTLPPFANEPVLELRRATVREQLSGALAALDARLPLRVPILIGEDRQAGDELASEDPGRPDRVVALAAQAGASEVDAAVAKAAAAQAGWAARPATERAAALLRAADWMRARRLELAALALRECAKPWPEADADVCEAIDYLEYYARGAIELERPPELVAAPGEHNELRRVARGVAAVVAPWNFPLAIPTGMAAAALATGNAALLKPAEQSPGCGLMVVEALRAGGVPPEVVALLPGAGEAGAALVRHPGVQLIAFTGSQAVGLEIVRAAADPRPGQAHVKQVVAELGGKNCVLIDVDADLDEAVPAVVASAFGYAGQKCSAAARVLVHEAVADAFEERLGGAIEVLRVGPAEDLESDVPPLIERAARDRVEACAQQAAREGRVIATSSGPMPSSGWFCPPRAVAGLPADSALLEREIFGPLLSVERVASIEEGCAIVERLPVALTGGLFARDPATVAAVAARLPVGNLYVNRAITGAMVGRQPFGGNRLSGTGMKAGGPDYLMQFVEARVVSENTMRHGLVA